MPKENEHRSGLFSGEELDASRWPQSLSGRMSKALWRVTSLEGLPKNCQCELYFWFSGQTVIPMSLSQNLPSQSWIISPENHYYEYASEELRWLAQPGRFLAGQALKLVDALSSWRQLEPVVYINNWLVSTCLTESEFDAAQLVSDLKREWPNRPWAFRTLSHRLNSDLISQLKDLGARPIVGRRVVFQDVVGEHLLGLRQVKNDHRILRRSKYEIEAARNWTDADWERVGELYRALYLEKYSLSNPQYSSAFFKASHQEGHLEYWGLRSPNGSLDAVIGLYRLGDVQANPVFGYDTSLPRSLGLYSSLTWLSFSLAEQNQAMIHASAGVADFKRNRGGKSEFEYSMVFRDHLDYRQRLSWKVVELLSNRIAGPIMQVLKL